MQHSAHQHRLPEHCRYIYRSEQRQRWQYYNVALGVWRWTRYHLYCICPTITHSYAQAATFNVKLTVYTQNGCEKTYQQNITISPAPVAGFTYQNTCEGDATQFTDQTAASGGVTIVAWAWNFGDPASGAANASTLKNPSHTFTAAGTYQVVLFTTNASGCTDSIQIPVVINPEPGVDFITGPVTCNGNPLSSTLIPRKQTLPLFRHTTGISVTEHRTATCRTRFIPMLTRDVHCHTDNYRPVRM